MKPLKLLSSAISAYRRDGLSYVLSRARKKARDSYLRHTGVEQGESYLDEDWDILILLDACRVDALQQVADDFDCLPDSVDSRLSVGSSSATWMKRTFTDQYNKEISETAHITANPNSEQYLSNIPFREFEEIWKHSYDGDLGTTPPRPVTDQAIRTYRERCPDRMMVHYMQPHFPSIPDPLGFGIRLGATNPDDHEWIWESGKPEQYTRDDIWRSYIENLRFVMSDVELLLESVDAEKVIITADHGNAYGERGVWGHPELPLEVLRRVPWAITTASDTGNYEPESPSQVSDTESVEDQLRALGYKQ